MRWGDGWATRVPFGGANQILSLLSYPIWRQRRHGGQFVLSIDFAFQSPQKHLNPLRWQRKNAGIGRPLGLWADEIQRPGILAVCFLHLSDAANLHKWLQILDALGGER